MQNAKREERALSISHSAFRILHSSTSVDERDLINLPQGRRSFHHFLQRRLAQEGHPFLFRGLLDLRRRAAIENHGADVIGEIEQLGDGLPSVEAGAVALQAARAFVELLSAEAARIEAR